MQLFVFHFQEVAALTFGRDAAQFRRLLTFMTLFSIALWGIVLMTIVMRFMARHILYRSRQYQAVETLLPETGEERD